MLSKLLLLPLIALAAAASPSESIRPWKPAGPGDSRGPCPMLNTLANHGYLPHNGRNLTSQLFAKAVVEALNVDDGYGTLPAEMFIMKWGKKSFDLEDLNTPHLMQHIASLSRDDVTANDKHIKPATGRISALLDDSTTPYLTAKSIAKSRSRVEALSSPNKLTHTEELLAYVESGLVLLIMSDHTVPSGITLPRGGSWSAPKEWVRTWLSEERLPVEQGWKRSERLLEGLDLLPVMKAIYDQKQAQSGKPSFWRTWLASAFASTKEL
ncbi:Peroxidase stcC-like protein [Cladobotryum mycophilum]|uniref:Peroxidase stcC-like protein n=1 Tax=Cladobotryum mycophilum TaxID=491253 RepID=A0ABR0SGL5_9HYPO